jgi:lysozyme
MITLTLSVDAENLLVKSIKEHEGLRLKVYKDIKGNDTIGFGHKLRNNERFTEISLDLAEQLLALDIAEAKSDCFQGLSCYQVVNDMRRIVLIELVFNMGLEKLLKFENMLTDLDKELYAAAATELLNSDYAREVGDQPGQRAYVLAQRLLNG